jgi:hypothetical protein
VAVPDCVPRAQLDAVPGSFPSVTHGKGTFVENFQELTATIKGRLLESGDRLFVIAPSADLVRQATAALASVGFKASFIDAQDLGDGIAIAAFALTAL